MLFCLEIAMNALSAPATLSMFIATIKILDFQMNALYGPYRAKRVHPY